MQKQRLVFLKDKFIPEAEAKLALAEPALLYGWGLFETMRCYKGNVPYLSAHLMRLKKSAALIRISLPLTTEKIKTLIIKTVRINSLCDARVRLNLWQQSKGALVSISASAYRPYPFRTYRRGFSACVASLRQNENSILSQIKSTNYLLQRLADQEARDAGFDQAVILNNRGYIAECSRSNIFIVKKQKIFTPSLDCGCLEGVTRKIVLDLAALLKISCLETKITLQDLLNADEAFITNSLIGIMPLVSLEKKAINRRLIGRYSKALIGKYKLILENAI